MQSFKVFLLMCFYIGNSFQQDGTLHPIFNGEDLTGWAVPNNNVWWTVQDGILEVRSDPDQLGSILWTEQEYRNFIFEADFKMVDGTVDSGIFMRNDHDQIQIGISGSLKRDMTCSPYIPGKGYPVEAEGVSNLLRQDDWNTIKIKAVGSTYTTWLNGQQVMTYTSESAVEEGPLGIQLHPKRDMHIQYRNIKASAIE